MKKEQEMAEVLPEVGLRLIKGGKGGDGPDWLAEIEPGTFFLARPRKDRDGSPFDGFTLLEFYTGGWQGRGRIISQEDPMTGANHMLTVDSVRFSSTMELFDVLGKPEPYELPEEEEKETDNDERDLPRPG